MRCYIAGPMRGKPRFNYPAFDECRDWLLSQGHEVISPADLDRKRCPGIETWDGFREGDAVRLAKAGFRLEDAIRDDEEAIRQCDAIVLLAGWRYSAGVKRELLFAAKTGNTRWYYEYLTVPDSYHGNLYPWTWEELSVTLGVKREPTQPAEPAVSPKASLLRDAEKAVCGDRNAQYGPPDQDFHRTAEMWTAMFGRKFTAHEVAMAMAALKLSRLVHQPAKMDSWLDLAGYAACGHECVVLEENRRGRQARETEAA